MVAGSLRELELILGREERRIPTADPLRYLRRERVLVTGADGSLGRELVAWLEEEQVECLGTDIDTLDVRYPIAEPPSDGAPTVIFHLAGAKHAPEGEVDPWGTLLTNAIGTQTMIELAAAIGAKVILASTCKAADPETAYGASKLLAERMTLNAGGSVARFYNVVESSGNVFELWRGLDPGEPVPVAHTCARYFVSLREAVSLLLWAAVLPSGRYAVDAGRARSMSAIAAALYPDRQVHWVSPRRGDRISEPRCAQSESIELLNHGLVQIRSPHDPAYELAVSA